MCLLDLCRPFVFMLLGVPLEVNKRRCLWNLPQSVNNTLLSSLRIFGEFLFYIQIDITES